MQLQGNIVVTGIKRREYQGKTYCDIYTLANLANDANAVGSQGETHRADPKLVDVLRHQKLPGEFAFVGTLEKYGDKSVITITNLADAPKK